MIRTTLKQLLSMSILLAVFQCVYTHDSSNLLQSPPVTSQEIMILTPSSNSSAQTKDEKTLQVSDAGIFYGDPVGNNTNIPSAAPAQHPNPNAHDDGMKVTIKGVTISLTGETTKWAVGAVTLLGLGLMVTQPEMVKQLVMNVAQDPFGSTASGAKRAGRALSGSVGALNNFLQNRQ